MKKCSRLIIPFILLVFIGCANPINRVTFDKYYGWGVGAEDAEDYELARENYYRALVNARMGNLEPQYHAASSYSLARMLGILCDHENAEMLLLDAVKFDQESNGPVHMSYLELARLKFDQKRYNEAIPYFEKALEIVDNEEFFNADPIGFAIIFEEYSIALREIGKTGEAEIYSKRAIEIREKYPEKEAIAERTPYLISCEK